MTGRDTPAPNPTALLLDQAGVPGNPALIRTLEGISGLGAAPAPEASTELAALMAAGGRAPAGRRHKRRITFLGGALAVSMGVGMSGVAAGTLLHGGGDDTEGPATRFSARESVDRVRPPGTPSTEGRVRPTDVAPTEAPAGRVKGTAPAEAGAAPRAAVSEGAPGVAGGSAGGTGHDARGTTPAPAGDRRPSSTEGVAGQAPHDGRASAASPTDPGPVGLPGSAHGSAAAEVPTPAVGTTDRPAGRPVIGASARLSVPPPAASRLPAAQGRAAVPPRAGTSSNAGGSDGVPGEQAAEHSASRPVGESGSSAGRHRAALDAAQDAVSTDSPEEHAQAGPLTASSRWQPGDKPVRSASRMIAPEHSDVFALFLGSAVADAGEWVPDGLLPVVPGEFVPDETLPEVLDGAPGVPDEELPEVVDGIPPMDAPHAVEPLPGTSVSPEAEAGDALRDTAQEPVEGGPTIPVGPVDPEG